MGCVSVNYPDAAGANAPNAAPEPPPAPGAPSTSPAPSVPSAPEAESGATRAGTPVEAPTESQAETASETSTPDEPALSWSQLTRAGRDHQLQREWEMALQRFEQAEILVSGLSPSHVRRRTVFGMQARLAAALAAAGETERAKALRQRLFDLAEASPAIGGPALVELALEQASESENGLNEAESETAARLRTLAIALAVAEQGRAQTSRIALARRIAEEALHAGRLGLARRAADLALRDAKILAASQRGALGAHFLSRARIRLAQNEVAGAEEDAEAAADHFEAAEASASFKAIAQAFRSEVLMRRGAMNEALAGLEEAETLVAERRVQPYAQRAVLAARARISAGLAQPDQARRAYQAALALPPEALAKDRALRRALKQELEALAN